MCLAPFVDDTVLRLLAHAVGAEIVRRGVGRRGEATRRADGCIKRFALLVGMVAHRDIVRMIREPDIRDRHAVLVLQIAMQLHGILLLRHVLADDPEARHIGVAVHGGGEGSTPATRIKEGGHEGHAERQRFQLISPDEAARRVVFRLVPDDPGHGRAAIEMDRLLEHSVNGTGRVAHVVLADLAGGIGETIGKFIRGRIEQEAGALDGIAGDAHDAGLLAL